MADDPNRDILPVKEGSCADTFSAIDLRDRRLVCKLDRYQLEDKYLRLLEEASNLKKLSNCQEDKIKRLGTKLIRLAGNPRCGLALDIADDRNRMAALELENTKLKEKIAVMRNQLLSHTMSGRSTSRCRNLVRPSSSGLVTCRSENNRMRAPSCQCIVGAGDDDNDIRNYLVKIEKLEAQKKDMACRIMELEKELAHLTNNQKERVAENVEYIRVWRQMKQLNDKLMTTQEKNIILTTEINDLKTTLEHTTRNNQEIVAVLSSERTRIAEIDDQILKVKTSQLTLREKDEQIRDLMSEIKILQQHNNELIMLTSKYGQVELENIELKKKLSDETQEQQTLKIAFSNEQVNIVALKATNERLFTKLQELQANIDTLTIQLTSLQMQDKKCNPIVTVPSYKEQCRTCCEMYDKIVQLEKTCSNGREDWQSADKSVQTVVITNTREQSTMIISSSEDKIPLESPLKECKTCQEGTGILSREKILKLLDQAQINTPLDASTTTLKEEFAGILDVAQRHSDREIACQCDASNIVQKTSQKRFACLENSNITPSQMFLILSEVLQKFLLFIDADGKTSSSFCQVSAIENSLTDANNNLPTITTCKIKQRDFSAGTTKDLESDYSCMNSCCSVEPNAVFSKNYDFTCKKTSATILTRDDSSSVKDIFKTTSIPVTQMYKESSCRDISKDFCAEKTIKLKRLKSSHYPRCNLMCHMRKAKDLLSVQEKHKLPYKIKCLGDREREKVESFPLLITDRQGLIEIHISRLQLSTSVAKIPDEDICTLQIYISWDVWGEKTVYTPRKRCPNLIFNSSSVYRIADLFSFFKNVLSEYLIFRVNVVRRDSSSYILARAKVSIKDILDYPQNKLHYVVPVNSVIPSFFDVNFGQLSLWVRLSCNVDMVEAFKKQCGISSSKEEKEEEEEEEEEGVPQKSPPEWLTNHINNKSKQDVPEDSTDQDATQPPVIIEFQFEPENSDHENDHNNNKELSPSINESNKISKGTAARNLDSKADNNEKKETNPLTDSSSLEEFRTLLANDISLPGASSTIRDICEVLSDRDWERYKQKSLLTFASILRDNSLNVEAQDYQNDISTCVRDCSISYTQDPRKVLDYKHKFLRNEKDAIVIEIVNMQFLNESSVMQDDAIRLLYIEYSFLGKCGEDMETVSVEKSKTGDQEMVFNYKKKFWINETTHPIQRDKLRAMLAETISPNVNFIVLSEPLPEEREVKDCEEIGYATFDIKQYALGDERKYILLPIKDNQNRKIGTLKIVVSGLNAIRQCLP